MSAGISPQNEQFITHIVSTGEFASREEVLDEAIDRLRLHHDLRQKIDEGCRQLENGDIVELNDDDELEAFFEGIKRERGEDLVRSEDFGG